MSLSNPLNNLLSKVNALDDILECPVCYDRLSGNIPQCTQGHSVCRKCILRIVHCPLCNSKFNGSRNYLAESIITTFEEIKNALKNLNDNNLHCKEVKKSEPAVTFVPKFPCAISDCYKTLSYNEMIFHIKKCHYDDLVDEDDIRSNKYKGYWSIVHEFGTVSEKIIYIKKMGIFFIKMNISNKGNVYGYVLTVQPSNDHFYYELTIDTCYNDDLCFDGPVESTIVKHQKGQYLYVGDAIYEDENGDDCFDCEIKITRE